MFTILYRWRVNPRLERQFIDAWSEVTKYYVGNSGASGSRLHRGNDGIFYGYAQWKSAELREKAFQNMPDLSSRVAMREAIEESFPEIQLEIISDYLQG